MYFLLLYALPFLTCLIGFLLFSKKPYKFQFLLLAAGLFMVIGITVVCMFTFGPEAESTDTEIWNGKIASRYSERVSCSHSYSCNCYTTTDSKGNSTEHCSTCYEHSYDVDWMAATSNGESVDFGRVDRQGLNMPPRYAEAFVGEPTAIEHSFTNYFKLATHNVVANFNDGAIGAAVPAYPEGFDMYRVNKLVDPDGLLAKDSGAWRYLLNNLNSDLGAAKQVNIVVFVTKQPSQRYAFNVQKAWLGGKKNDVIVLIGAPASPKIEWVQVITWSTNPAIKTGLRDDLLTIGSLDNRDAIAKTIRTHVLTEFQRIHMKDQKYLRQAWEPSHGATTTLLILFNIIAIGGCAAIRAMGDAENSYLSNDGY